MHGACFKCFFGDCRLILSRHIKIKPISIMKLKITSLLFVSLILAFSCVEDLDLAPGPELPPPVVFDPGLPVRVPGAINLSSYQSKMSSLLTINSTSTDKYIGSFNNYFYLNHERLVRDVTKTLQVDFQIQRSGI